MPKKYKRLPDGYYRYTEVYSGVKIDLRSKDADELDEKIRKKKNQIDQGEIESSENINVKVWADTWLQTYKKPNVTKKNYGVYKSIVECHIKPAIGNMKVSDVKQIHLQKILTSRAGYSTSHILRVGMTIRAIFHKAYVNGLIVKDPTLDLTNPVGVTGSHRSITSDEKKVLFRVCESHPQGLYPLLMYYLGLRPGECCALTWGDIDFNHNLVRVAFAVESGTKNIKEPKTTAGIRNVPIPAQFYNRLLKESEGKKINDFVLLSQSGKMAYSQTCNYWWKSIRRAMNIEMGADMYRNKIINDLVASDFTAYCLRHTYCTNLQRAGVSLNVAKYLMGHRDIKTTANIYTHQTDDITLDAKHKIDNFNLGKRITYKIIKREKILKNNENMGLIVGADL